MRSPVTGTSASSTPQIPTAPTRSSRPRVRTTARTSGRGPTAEARATAGCEGPDGAEVARVRTRGPGLVLVAVAAVIQVACLGSESSPSELVDGSAVRRPSVTLDGVSSRQVETKVAALDIRKAASGPVSRCLATTHEHVPHAPIVRRVGVAGTSVTYRTASGRAAVACDGTNLSPESSRTWCGVALGRMRGERLLDPRLDLASCSTPSGEPVAFVWVEPGPRTRYVTVGREGYVEVYPVMAGLPVRVATTSGIDVAGSSAAVDLSEHDAEGQKLRSYTLWARVAG